MTTEWRQIDFCDADIGLLGVTKITDVRTFYLSMFVYGLLVQLMWVAELYLTVACWLQTICDGARQYAERIQLILENNCYYDLDDNNQFDVTDTVCLWLYL